MDSPRRIGVLLPNWVGDVVMATPALRALRGHFRQSRITFIGRPITLETLRGTPWADRTIPDHSGGKPRIRRFLSQVAAIREARLNLMVLLPNSFRSAALAWAAGIGRIAGYNRDGRGWLLTHKLAPPRQKKDRGFLPAPMIDYYLNLMAVLGVRPDGRHMELAVTPREQAEADELLAEAGVDPARPVVMLNPGAAYGPSKMWEPSRYAELADLLAGRHGAQIVINAAPAERGIAADVARAMRRPPAVSFADRDNAIGMVKGLMRRCTLLVTNDTGARHVAAAMGIGVVTLFGSTDPRWAQIDYECERLVRVEVPCSPCQRKLCLQPAGPFYHQCMEKIDVGMVLAACEDVLGRLTRRARGPQP